MITDSCPGIDLRATGHNIFRLREERGYSVADLQEYFGFAAPQAVYKWQNGQSLPTVDNLYALSRLLGVPMDDILVPLSGASGVSGKKEKKDPRDDSRGVSVFPRSARAA